MFRIKIFQVPIAIPLIVLVFSVFLVIAPIINDPKVNTIQLLLFPIFRAKIHL